MKKVRVNLTAVLLLATVGVTSSFAAVKHARLTQGCASLPGGPQDTTYDEFLCKGTQTVCCYVTGTETAIMRP